MMVVKEIVNRLLEEVEWFEQDIDNEGEEGEEGKGGIEVLILSSISVLMGDFEFLGCFGSVRRCREEVVLRASWKRAQSNTKHDIRLLAVGFILFVTFIASSSSKSSSTKGDVLEGGGVSSNVTLSDSLTFLVVFSVQNEALASKHSKSELSEIFYLLRVRKGFFRKMCSN
ncbi:hypothetical protein Tco_1428409 [Tanacetum coccineum]